MTKFGTEGFCNEAEQESVKNNFFKKSLSFFEKLVLFHSDTGHL